MKKLSCGALVLSASLLSACLDKPEARPVTYTPIPRDFNIEHALIPTPTNPEGGLTPGKVPAPSALDMQKRQNAVSQKPILLTRSVAGLSTTNKRSEFRKILSEPFFTAENGTEYYTEGLFLQWAKGEDPTPLFLGIREGYAGPLSLPAPYGKILIGQDLSATLVDEAAFRLFANTIAATVEGKDPKNFDCEKEMACSIHYAGTEANVETRTTYLAVNKGKLSMIYFPAQDMTFFQDLVGPLNYDGSYAGLHADTDRAAFEKSYGPGVPQQGGGSGYSTGVIVEWTPENLLSNVIFLRPYAGKFELKNGQKFGIGDNLSLLAPNVTDEKELVKAVYRIFEGKDESFDCLTATPKACDVRLQEDGTLGMMMRNLLFFFDKDRNLFYISASIR